jgi:hypothetical protein
VAVPARLSFTHQVVPMTSKKKDRRLRAAGMILRRLEGGDIHLSSALSSLVQPVEACHTRVQRTWRLLAMAEQRRWPAAARHLAEHLLLEAHALQSNVNDVLQRQPQLHQATQQQDNQPPPSLRLLADEPQQLEEEFEGVEYRLREGLICVQTEPIVLEELELGPFSIELHVKRLCHHPDSNCFLCIALKPNTPSHNSSVTHPHVQDCRLCAGEATLPIANALQQGRICDAFCLVHAVLREYNSGSPYVAIDEWEGVRCEDCECCVDRDQLSCCEACEQDVCDDCMRFCDVCEESCCRGCLDRDDRSRRNCCPDCRNSCTKCGRTVDADSFVTESELCPQCEEERLADEQEQEEKA